MTASYSLDHVGRLIIHSTDDTEVEIPAVTLAAAEDAFDALTSRTSARIVAGDGTVYLIDGLRFIAAQWRPSP